MIQWLKWLFGSNRQSTPSEQPHFGLERSVEPPRPAEEKMPLVTWPSPTSDDLTWFMGEVEVVYAKEQAVVERASQFIFGRPLAPYEYRYLVGALGGRW